MWLFLAFLAIPLIEIALFIQIGGAIGLWPTLAIVVLTAIIGTWAVRSQGLGALARLQAALERGGDPATPLIEGVLILIAGVLLLTPGFFTDALGFALLLPPVRRALIAAGAARAMRSGSFTVFTARTTRHRDGWGETIDGEFTVMDPDAPRDPRRDLLH